ncbi:MAG: CinA family protein, partial [Pseudomonadota bacterium]
MDDVPALLDALRRRGWTVTAAESCTGGMVAAAITDVAGSSEVFERGFVTYSNAAKAELLGVSLESLDAYGAVSEA